MRGERLYDIFGDSVLLMPIMMFLLLFDILQCGQMDNMVWFSGF